VKRYGKANHRVPDEYGDGNLFVYGILSIQSNRYLASYRNSTALWQVIDQFRRLIAIHPELELPQNIVINPSHK
jgi:hypothetical protein